MARTWKTALAGIGAAAALGITGAMMGGGPASANSFSDTDQLPSKYSPTFTYNDADDAFCAQAGGWNYHVVLKPQNGVGPSVDAHIAAWDQQCWSLETAYEDTEYSFIAIGLGDSGEATGDVISRDSFYS